MKSLLLPHPHWLKPALSCCFPCKKAHGRKDRAQRESFVQQALYKWLHILKRWRRWVLTMTRLLIRNFWGLPLDTLQLQLSCYGPQLWVGSPILPLVPAPASTYSHVPTISFSWKTMYLSGIPFKTTWGWYHNHCFHISSPGLCTCNGHRTEQGPLLPGAPYIFYSPQDIDFPGAALCSVAISCFPILRHEIGHSVGKPRSANHALCVVLVKEASLSWPGVGRLHHHTPSQGSVSVQLSPKKVSWQTHPSPTLLSERPLRKGLIILMGTSIFFVNLHFESLISYLCACSNIPVNHPRYIHLAPWTNPFHGFR